MAKLIILVTAAIVASLIQAVLKQERYQPESGVVIASVLVARGVLAK